MKLFPFPLNVDKLREAFQIAASLGEHASAFFSPTPAVRNYLESVTDTELAQAITVSGKDGYGPLQEKLQEFGALYNGTKAGYGNAVALAIWELSRRGTEKCCGKTIVPTFGEIAAVAAAAGFGPPKAVWTIDKIVDEFAGKNHYCATTYTRRLAVYRGELSPGEEVGIRSLLLNTQT